MNFLSGGRGFSDQVSSKGTHPFSHSSSSPSTSSSSSQKILVPFSYQQNQRSWLSSSSINNNGEDDVLMMDSANLCEGDENHQLDLGVGASSSANNTRMIEREHMFDKVVTPSDVGKLNRLVIPKQHAEKYFPLDSSTNEKGLLLNFEDRNGKPWRFRYSYWNSSQSYVMTKGWSRFVKEKQLDAGDIVSFQRGVGELSKDRLFIDWRRRPDAPDHFTTLPHPHFSNTSSFYRSNNIIQYPAAAAAWNHHPLFLQPHPPPEYSHLHSRPAAGSMSHHQQQQSYSYSVYGSSPNYYYDTCNFNNSTTVVNGNPCPSGSLVYFRSRSAAQQQRGSTSVGRIVEPLVFDSVPVVQGKAAAKRLRLFGVNMDCPISDSDESCEMSSSSSLPTPINYSQFLPSIPSLQFRNYDVNPQDTQEESKPSMSLDLDLDI
ncbi:hypothetical protein K7X08_013444 [Anisodus acutangulus]|uniref:TF-B3 domain-containing protein n=1 Tax=Anisodus acutangulus TaxID=402998 RepID=A0A9Q1RGN1_9SOLA|nr:hypothetical protein K7X08_013444 [Anisodus acutangulus]